MRGTILACIAVVFSISGTLAFAQQAVEDAATLDEITVVGYRDAFKKSLKLKRDSDQIVDVITAEELGQFPDQNVAEALQRITGVQITRNNGEGESVNIRGLAANFTRVEVDGRSTAVTIDSASPERQSVLSVFSSDLYETIEVVKSPTAADVEGGVGGIVRLKTPNPLEIGELKWGLDVGLTDADQRDDSEPSFNGFVSNVVADGRLGFLAAITFEERDRAIDKIQSNQDWQEVDAGFLADDMDPALQALIGGRFPGRLRQEQRRGDAPKINLNTKVQYLVTPQMELYGNAYVTREDREEDRARIQVQFSRGNLAGGTLGDDGTLTSASFGRARTEFLSFVREADINTEGLSAGLKWSPPGWQLQGELSYASSEEDFVETRVAHRTNRDDLSGYSILGDSEYPDLFSAAAGLAPEDLDLRDLNQQKRIIGTEETHLEFDAERLFTNGMVSSVEFGFRYAAAEFDRRQGQVNSPAAGDLTYADGQPFVIDGSYADGFGGPGLLRAWPSIDPVALYNQFPSNDPFVFDDENLWTIEEDVTAAYALANFTGENETLFWRGNAGIRLVRTEYSGQGRVNIQSTDLPVSVDPDGNAEVFIDDAPAIDRDYDEFLPSINVLLSAYDGAPLQFRAAVSRALARPTLNEINPGVEVNTDDGDIVRGNPELDPFTAWQFDLGVEYYWGDDAGATATLFYKDVDNFIAPVEFTETRAFAEVGLPAQEFEVSTFRNGGDAKIQGIELGLQLPLEFLPLDGFGVFANYTYTDSEFQDDFGNTFDFPGASEHAYNLVAFYENDGFSSRLAYNFRDDFLIVPSSSSDGSNAQFGQDQGRLDLGIRYRFNNGFRIWFDALNLTEEQNFKYYDTPQRLEDLEVEGRIYSLRFGVVF